MKTLEFNEYTPDDEIIDALIEEAKKENEISENEVYDHLEYPEFVVYAGKKYFVGDTDGLLDSSNSSFCHEAANHILAGIQGFNSIGALDYSDMDYYYANTFQENIDILIEAMEKTTEDEMEKVYEFFESSWWHSCEEWEPHIAMEVEPILSEKQIEPLLVELQHRAFDFF